MVVRERPGSLIPAAALVSLLLFDVLRVWLPSLLFVVGDAGETSALVMGAIALGVVVIAPAAVFLLGRRAFPGVWLPAVTVLVLSRGVLQAADGGALQFVASSVAIVAASLALSALATGVGSPGEVRIGVLLGVGASATIHVGLATTDLVWRTGALAWTTTLALLAATWLAASTVRRQVLATPDRTGPAWPWWLFGPILLLLGVLALVPGRVAVATRWSDPWVAVTIVVVAGLLLAGTLLGRWVQPSIAGPTGAGLVLLGTTAALQAASVTAVVAQLTLGLGIGFVVAACDGVAVDAPPRRVAVAAAAIPLGFTVLGFAYYAAYDLVLPYPNRIVLLLTAGIVALGALVAGAGREPRTIRERGHARRLLTVAAGTAAVAVTAAFLVAGTERGPTAPGDPGEPIRIALANIHMGFDPQGRLSVHDLGDALAAEDPDIVVLNEVDRGWMTTGGRDTLRQLSGRLGMPYVFAPAADEVWGNAILSRFPVQEWNVERLPRGQDAMARSQLIAVLRITDDQPIALVATHLSHVDPQGTRLPQARAVAATIARLEDRGVPVVLAGDLNAQPGDAELAVFEDVTISALRDGNPTYPSWDPQVQIDHILATDAFWIREARVLDTQASDHLSIIAELELVLP